MIQRYLIVALAAAVLSAGAVWYLVAGRMAAKDAEISALDDANDALQEQRKADQATLVLRDRANAVRAREMASAGHALAASTRRNQEWADQPVPQEVKDALK